MIREHAAFVWRVLQHLGVSENELDDLCQEVFVVVLRQLAKFEGRSSLRTWIYGICRNVAQHAPATQDDALWLKQTYAQLVAALDGLDVDQRTVFVLLSRAEPSAAAQRAADFLQHFPQSPYRRRIEALGSRPQ